MDGAKKFNTLMDAILDLNKAKAELTGAENFIESLIDNANLTLYTGINDAEDEQIEKILDKIRDAQVITTQALLLTKEFIKHVK